MTHKNDNYHLTAKHNKSTLKRCGFCTVVGHTVDSCPLCLCLASISHEYVLTTKNRNQEQYLRDRVKGITTNTVVELGENPMGSLAKEESKFNFVLMEVQS